MTLFQHNAPEHHADIEEGLTRLRESTLKRLSREQIVSIPKVVWKATVAYECLANRTVETADGVIFGWNTENWTTAFTMARSLIETAALSRYLTERIAEAVERRDLMEVDRALMECLFATRHPPYLSSGGIKAVSVVTLITKLDQSLFGKDTPPRIKDTYEYLCEFAHPNGTALLFLHADHDFEEPSVRFGMTLDKDRRQGLLAQIGPALGMILVVETCRSRFQGLLPDLRTLAEKFE
jgi:hypothetical protein